MKKIFLLLMIVSSVFGMSAFSVHKHPNIVFIFSDDQCWDTIGAIGGEVLTPHLDKLVAEGVFFKNAYNSGAWQGAVCIASRTMLMTGKQLWKSHQYSDSKQRNPSDFWSTFFKNNGYKTYFTGKWHISRISPDIIYSSTGTIMPGMPTYSDPKLGGNYKWNEH